MRHQERCTCNWTSKVELVVSRMDDPIRIWELRDTDDIQANPNVHWPDEPRSYVWRYMHHKSVYSLAPEFDKMQDLADDFIRHLRITCNPGQFSAIFDKLKYFVALWTRNWLDCGMLQEDGGLGLSRSNEFEYQLKLRQAIWPAQEETLVGLLYKWLSFQSNY